MSPPPAPADLLEEAVAFAREAGELTLRWFRSRSLTVSSKDDGTPVTEADRAAERLLRERIVAAHPEDGIVGEEEEPVAGTSGRRWIIDPIDGTKAFTHGVPLYSQLVAVEDGGGPLVGVINLPGLGETVAAGRGLGCSCDGEPARVSDHADLDGAYLTTSGLGSWSDARLDAVRDSPVNLRTWGDGYGYALVATGRVEAMVDPVASAWDLAPMPVILTEAGGRFTDLSGTASYDSGSGLGSNGHLHDALLDLLG